MPADVHMTTELFFRATAVAAIADIILGFVLQRLITRQRFQVLGWLILLFSGIFYGLLWTAVLNWGWDWFYAFVFPPWMKSLGFAWGLAYALLGAGMWWLAKGALRSVLAWALLGGLEGILTHAWAIWVGGVVSKPPIIQGASPWAVLLFACFEKMFYWLVILGLAAGVSIIIQKLRQRH